MPRQLVCGELLVMKVICEWRVIRMSEGGKITKNVECPYCHVREDRQVVETGQVSVGRPMVMYRFKCDDCGRYFWKHEKVQR